jgi:Lrp/AsnC family leucine-responsive transcriptional regulator
MVSCLQYGRMFVNIPRSASVGAEMCNNQLMDRIDQHILALLARNGRMSYTELGTSTGLSTSAAQQRVRRLEARGIICGYEASFDAESLGRSLTAFISMRVLDSSQYDVIADLLTKLPEVVTAFTTTGDSDFLCKAMVGSTSELEQLISKIRSAGSVSTTTTVALNTLVRNRPLVDPPPEDRKPRTRR